MKHPLMAGLAVIAIVVPNTLEAVTIVTPHEGYFPGEESLESVINSLASDAVEVFPDTFELSGLYRGEIVYLGTAPTAEPIQIKYLTQGGLPQPFLVDTPAGRTAEAYFPARDDYAFMLYSSSDGVQYTQDGLNGGRKQAIILHSASTNTYFIAFEAISYNDTISGDFNDVVFRLDPIPEPSSLVMGLIGVGMALSMRKRPRS